jgi:tetratricopeptide (TPR) repeat protein
MSKKRGSLDAIGRSLGTRYLVTGAVQRTDDLLQATACLSESASGKQLWRSRFQMNSGGNADVEEVLASDVATGLAVAIDAKERERLNHDSNGKDQSQTTPLILMADHLTKQFQLTANRYARKLAEKACLLDPTSARAHAVLSRTHQLDWRYAWTADPDQSIEKALDYANLAIEHDPMEASGYAELGMNRHFLREHEPALAAYQRALEINPNDPDILADFGDLLISQGNPEQAIEPLHMAIHLRPERAAMYRYYLAGAFEFMGDDETVIKLFSDMGNDHEAHRLLATSSSRLGLNDQAAHHVDLTLKVHPNFSLAHWRKILPHRDADHRERFIDDMERAGFF